MEHISKGMTLVELSISLAIASILIATVSPDLTRLLSSTRRDGYVRSLANQLKAARSYAILHSNYVTLCPLKDMQCADSWQDLPIVIFSDPNKNLRIDSDETIYRTLDAHAKGDRLSFPRKGIVFENDGSLAGLYTGSFLYCSKTARLNEPAVRITVSQSGRMRVRQANKEC